MNVAESLPAQTAADSSGDTLATKLSRVMRACGYVQKDGRNQQQNYKFASAAAVLAHVNEALAAEHVFPTVEPTVIKDENIETKNGGTQQRVMVRVTITLHDGDTGEQLVTSGLGCGQDSGDKAIMKAQTAANKYAWMLALNISTGEDPEADPRTDEAVDDRPRSQNTRAAATPKPAAQQTQRATSTRAAGPANQGAAKPAAAPATQPAAPPAATNAAPAAAATAAPANQQTRPASPAAAAPAPAATSPAPSALNEWIKDLMAVHSEDEAARMWHRKPALTEAERKRAWEILFARACQFNSALTSEAFIALVRGCAPKSNAPKPAQAAAAPDPATEARNARAAELETQINEAEHPGTLAEIRVTIGKALASHGISNEQAVALNRLAEKARAEFAAAEKG